MVDAFLFTGIAGLKKRNCLAHLRTYILKNYEPYLGQESEDQLIPIVELARLIRQEVDGDFFELYTTYEERLEKFRTRLQSFNSEKYKSIRCVFIHTHLTHFMTGHFRSWVGSPDYAQLFPGVEIKRILHLIDNVYSCQHEVAKDGYPYSLDQLIIWRDTEQMVTEILAGLLFKTSVFEKSKVLSVNHCLSTVADILFNETRFHIYMAFPISKIRDIELLRYRFGDCKLAQLNNNSVRQMLDDEQEFERYLKLNSALSAEFPDSTLSEIISSMQEQNQDFRRFFTKEFVAYDPSTIDEVPLVIKASQLEGDCEAISLASSDCWPSICPPEARLCGRDLLSTLGTLDVSASEVKELRVPTGSDQRKFRTSIHRQVRSRDFRLIEQSHALIAYRPTMGGRWSTSVRQEIDYVYRRLKKPFFVIKDIRDSPLDEGQALGWEYGAQHWGEWDLSIASQRALAFDTAKNKLLEHIQDASRE